MNEKQSGAPLSQPELAMIVDVLDRVKYAADTDPISPDLISVGEIRVLCQAALRPTVLSEIVRIETVGGSDGKSVAAPCAIDGCALHRGDAVRAPSPNGSEP